MTHESNNSTSDFFDPYAESLQVASQELLQEFMEEKVCALLDEPFEQAAEKGVSVLEYDLTDDQLRGTMLGEQGYNHVFVRFDYTDDGVHYSAPNLLISAVRAPEHAGGSAMLTSIDLAGPWEGGAGAGGEVSSVVTISDPQLYEHHKEQVVSEEEELPVATVADLRLAEQALDALVLNHPELLTQAA